MITMPRNFMQIKTATFLPFSGDISLPRCIQPTLCIRYFTEKMDEFYIWILGCPELVAKSPTEYVNIATRLGTDRE